MKLLLKEQNTLVAKEIGSVVFARQNQRRPEIHAPLGATSVSVGAKPKEVIRAAPLAPPISESHTRVVCLRHSIDLNFKDPVACDMYYLDECAENNHWHANHLAARLFCGMMILFATKSQFNCDGDSE
jgi:hypothetical protein